jgi:hypothetical protein
LIDAAKTFAAQTKSAAWSAKNVPPPLSNFLKVVGGSILN